MKMWCINSMLNFRKLAIATVSYVTLIRYPQQRADIEQQFDQTVMSCQLDSAHKPSDGPIRVRMRNQLNPVAPNRLFIQEQTTRTSGE